MKKMVFIVNPRSGKMKIKNQLLNVLEIFGRAGFDIRICITAYQGHAIQIASEISQEDADIIVVSGGDGTLNEVVTGILKSQKNIPVGYIPTGSTNDFASTFGLPSDIKKAATAIIEGEPNMIDIGNFNKSRYFTYIASFGVFTSVSYTTPQAVKNTFGHMAYVFEGIKDVTKIVPYHVRVKTDDASYEGKYIFGSVTNTTSVGGLVKLDSSIVKMNDGLFETVLVKMPSNINDLNKIIGGLTASDFSDDVFEFIKSSHIEMEFDSGMDWSLDGEHEVSGNKVTIDNIHRAITLVGGGNV